MEVSSAEPQFVPMDLSKSYNSRSRGHPEAMDLAKKPEWYHRRPASTELPASFRSRASSSYSSPGNRRDLDQNYINSTGLDLYHDGVHGNLWHAGFYGDEQSVVPESSGAEESDSGSDVIFLVSSAKEPILCSSFIQDDVRRMAEPAEAASCYLLPQPMSSPSPESSYSEETSDSSVDIPVHHARPVVLLADLSSVYGNQRDSAEDVSSDDSDVVEVPVVNGKKKSRKAVSPARRAPGQRAVSSEVRRSNRSKKSASETTPLSGAGVRHSLKRRAKQNAVGIYNENCDTDDLMDYVLGLSSSEDSNSQPNRPQPTSDDGEESAGESRTDRKSRRREPRRENAIARKPSPAPPGRTLRSSKPTPTPSPTKKPERKRVARRRRKRCAKLGPSSPFGPAEPEIKLRFLQTREKKEKKSDGFSPFVHVDERSCRVVNYQEDEARLHGSGEGGRGGAAGGFVPVTSCYKLGRLGPDSEALLCCLCGQMANAPGLGDLHGPYRPASSPLDAQRPKPAAPSNGCPAEENEKNGSEEPLHLEECWVHEDCGIWSAGVFLVRGKLYGLEEAARLAHEAVCLSCQQTGAIMGCFQKGCSRNFHYTCAIKSGCVLNEENFSMRCPDHKIKSLTTVTRQHKR